MKKFVVYVHLFGGFDFGWRLIQAIKQGSIILYAGANCTFHIKKMSYSSWYTMGYYIKTVS